MKNIFPFLFSTRLFIAILAVCAVVSLIGIIIPQNFGYDEYTQKFGPGFANIIIDFGWDHIFSSPWFIVPLALFCVNLICCIGNRLLLLSMTLRQMKKKQTRVTGSFLLHAGLLFLVAGGIIQYYCGYDQSVIVTEGTQEVIEQFNLKIFLDDFSIIRNGKGDIINYRSNLILRDTNDTVVLRAPTMVNAPLKYHDAYFYQTNYGYVPNAVDKFRAVVADSGGDTLFSGVIPYKTAYPLGKSGLSLECSDFLCDFYYDFENRAPVTRSHNHDNPAFKIIMFSNRTVIDSQWIFQKFPQMNRRFGRYAVAIPSYVPLYYSGIQVQKKPGTVYILIGIISVSIGLLLVLVFPFRRKKTM